MSKNEYDLQLWLRIAEGGGGGKLQPSRSCSTATMRRCAGSRSSGYATVHRRKRSCSTFTPIFGSMRQSAGDGFGQGLPVPGRAQPVAQSYPRQPVFLRSFRRTRGYFRRPGESQIETEEMLELVAEAVSQLPDRCREVFLKSRSEELSNAEIALRMEISVNTVEAQMKKALRYLRKLLAKG